MMENNRKYVIGVDGGGTKTTVALADLKGRIIAQVKGGSAHPRNIGVKNAVKNVVSTIEKILPKNKRVISTFLGLPAMEEEFKSKKEIIKKEFLKHRKINSIFRGNAIIGSDQLVGFRAGTDRKEGVMLNAGSGCAIHGWRGKKEVKIDGWGYLSEMGSAFWVGQKGLQAIWKDLDGRRPKTLITKLAFQKLKVKSWGNLIEKIYSKDLQDIVRYLSILVYEAGKKKDKIAKEILIEAGEELALSAETAIRKLDFQKERFPLVLNGSMFKSKIVLDTVKKEIKKIATKVQFVRLQKEPVSGAVKLAIESLKG